MNRLLLMMANKPNLRLLENTLASHYSVSLFDEARYRGGLRTCDLIIVDGMMLERYMDAIVSAKHESLPVFLPVLLVTSRHSAGLATRNLWKSVDEVILTPIERVELQARVEVMLRTRQMSAELYQRNQDMEAFVHAVIHELRAPLRAMSGFAEAVIEDAALPEGCEAVTHLQRIMQASQEMKRILDSLLTFARLGCELQMQTVWLQPLVDSCLRELEREIASTLAQIECKIECDTVEADPLLLKVVMCNLISNALKFRCIDRKPLVQIRAYRRDEFCRIEVQDNGIGMLPEDLVRIFTPFTRLHGVEEYAGVGLGLSIVRKAVTLMGGRYGAESVLNEGSTFWVELPQVEGSENESTVGG
ncbi:Phytochrome-like protein cph1 [bacterium HR16]|nr:Phytochrome-like protein cph1 [bacterium HR16]